MKLIRREEFQRHEALMKVTIGLHNALWKESDARKIPFLQFITPTPELYSETPKRCLKSLKDLRLETALRKKIIMTLLKGISKWIHIKKNE